MTRALLPRRASPALPDLELRLAPARPPAAPLADCLLPQVWGFRLQMVLLTDRAFPLPIWSALQIRNRLVQHARHAPPR